MNENEEKNEESIEKLNKQGSGLNQDNVIANNLFAQLLSAQKGISR